MYNFISMMLKLLFTKCVMVKMYIVRINRSFLFSAVASLSRAAFFALVSVVAALQFIVASEANEEEEEE